MSYEDGNQLLRTLMIATAITFVVIAAIIIFALWRYKSSSKNSGRSVQNINSLSSNYSNASKMAKLQEKIMYAEAKGKFDKKYLSNTNEYKMLLEGSEVQSTNEAITNQRLQMQTTTAETRVNEQTLLVQLGNASKGQESYANILKQLNKVPRVGAIQPANVEGDPPFTLSPKDFPHLPSFIIENNVRLVGVSYVRPTNNNFATNVTLRFRYASKLLQKKIDIQFNQTKTTIALARTSVANISIRKKFHNKNLKYFARRGIESVELSGIEAKGLMITGFDVKSYDEVTREAIFLITVAGYDNRGDASSKELEYKHIFSGRSKRPKKYDGVLKVVSTSVAPNPNPFKTRIDFKKYFGDDFELKKIWFDNKKFALDKNAKIVEYKILYNKLGRYDARESVIVEFANSYYENIIRNIGRYNIGVKNYPIFLGQMSVKVNYNKYRDIFHLVGFPEAKFDFDIKKLKNITTNMVELTIDITLGNYQTTVPVMLYEDNGETCIKIKGVEHG